MPYTHIVSFSYPTTTTESTRSEAYTKFLALKDECKLQNGSKYILNIQAGKKNISPEGMGKGFDQLFIVTFENSDHVKYYLEEDAKHLEFASWVRGHVSDAFIYDFES
ncbi:unnamed protein product [Sympodiomycopsis kandeliae]